MACKGIHNRWKLKRKVGGSNYAAGKRCTTCEVFMKVEDLYCPCCGYKLRNKPRNKSYKEKLRVRKGEEVKRIG